MNILSSSFFSISFLFVDIFIYPFSLLIFYLLLLSYVVSNVIYYRT